MADWASLLVPAVSALGGVALTQAWTSLSEERRWRREDRQKVYESRRAAVAQYVLALNGAIDATRELVRTESGSEEEASHRTSYDTAWNAAYVCQLELLLLLPGPARTAVEHQIDAAFAWRETALAARAADHAPKNEAVIEELQPWMHPGLPGE